MKALVVVHYTYIYTQLIPCSAGSQVPQPIGNLPFPACHAHRLLDGSLGIHPCSISPCTLHFSVLCLLVLLPRLPGHSSVGGRHGNVPQSRSIPHKQGMKRDGPSSSGIPKTVLWCKHRHEFKNGSSTFCFPSELCLPKWWRQYD